MKNEEREKKTSLSLPVDHIHVQAVCFLLFFLLYYVHIDTPEASAAQSPGR